MGGAIDQDFSNLLARLYAGIGEETPWRAFLEALAQWMNARFATLIISAEGKKVPATFVTPGSDPLIDSDYAQLLFAEDPFQGLPEGQVTSYEEFMAALPAHEFGDYRKTVHMIGYDQVLGLDLRFAQHFEARFRVSRHNTQPAFTVRERARLQALVPHLRIAVNLFEKLQFAGAQHGVFYSAAEGLGLAVLLLDRDMRIVSSNMLADEILQQAEGLRRRGDVLMFSAREHQAAITTLLATDTGVSRFRLKRPAHGDLMVTARPVDLRAIHAGAGALALFFVRPGGETTTDPQALQAFLGLTAAEARLAAVLAEGLTLVEAAKKLGIAHNTAKAQLSAIFGKTGVHRQTQLMALMASIGG